MSFQEKTREASAGNTAIAVTLVSLECVGTPSELVFRISMTNHTCSIPGYNLDFEQHVSLSTSDGLTFSDGFAYDVLSADDHHPLGVLTVAAQRSGSPIIGCGTQSLSLEIVDIDQAPGESVSLTWTGSVLDGIRDCP